MHKYGMQIYVLNGYTGLVYNLSIMNDQALFMFEGNLFEIGAKLLGVQLYLEKKQHSD